MAVRRIAHPSVEERRSRGKEARDRAPLSSHDGWTPASDRSITDFSQGYADQNERDYQAFVGAIRSGRLQALEGV